MLFFSTEMCCPSQRNICRLWKEKQAVPFMVICSGARFATILVLCGLIHISEPQDERGRKSKLWNTLGLWFI